MRSLVTFTATIAAWSSPALVAGVLEHREGLAAVVDQHALALQPVPGEAGLGGGPALPFSSGPKPCDGADWQTWTVPVTTPSMADRPGGATECRGARPSWARKPSAMVAISGEQRVRGPRARPPTRHRLW